MTDARNIAGSWTPVVGVPRTGDARGWSNPLDAQENYEKAEADRFTGFIIL